MRANNIVITIFFLFSFVSAFSQSKIFEYTFKENPSSLKSYYGLNEETNTQLLLLSYNNKIQRFLIKSDSIKQSISKLIKPEEYEIASSSEQELYNIYNTTYIGSAGNENYIEEYYLNDKSITTLSTDQTTGKVTVTDKIGFEKKERFVSAFMQGDTYFFLTYFRYSDKIRIYKKKINSTSIGYTKDLELSKEMLNGVGDVIIKKSLENFSNFFEYPYVLIENGKTYPLAITSPLFKIYIQPNKLIFTLDNQYNKTIEIVIDLNDLSSEFMGFEQPHNLKDKIFEIEEASTNSFIIDSLLLQANVINERFHFSFCNRQTGEVYKSYSPKNKDDLDILNGGIIKEVVKKEKNDTSIASFKKMIRKISSNKIAITAQNINDTMNITIGSLFEKTSVSFAQLALSLSLSVIGTYAINSLPNTFGYSIFIFYQTSKENSISFQSLFNNKTFEHLTGDVNNNDVRDKINLFILQNNVPKKNAFLLQSKEHYYLGFLQKENNKFLIYRF